MIFSTKYTTAIFIIPLKNNDRTIQDGSGVGRSYTHLLQGPNQNYNQITQQSTWRTNWRLTEQKSHHQRFTEAISRLVGRAEPWALVRFGRDIPAAKFPCEERGVLTPCGALQPRAPEPGEGAHIICGCENQQGFSLRGRDGILLETQGPS